MQGHSSQLTLAQRQLVQEMSKVGYGRVESFAIVNGQPELKQHRLVFELRLPEEGKTPRAQLKPFTLKKNVEALFNHFTRVGRGWVDWIEVKDGLPERVRILEGELRNHDAAPPSASERGAAS